jgi:hypothetical protein
VVQEGEQRGHGADPFVASVGGGGTGAARDAAGNATIYWECVRIFL